MKHFSLCILVLLAAFRLQAHDFSIISAWVEGLDGNGEGEYLLYSFPGTCPGSRPY